MGTVTRHLSHSFLDFVTITAEKHLLQISMKHQCNLEQSNNHRPILLHDIPFFLSSSISQLSAHFSFQIALSGLCRMLESLNLHDKLKFCFVAGSHVPLTPSPRTPSPGSASKKLSSPFRCLSLKKMEEAEDETEQLQKPDNNPYQDLETAYVAHVCLTWEALHCQFTQLSQKISCQPENPTSYNHSAQQFQQFQVLLQRFIENEPFELGPRVETYARARNLLPKLLQVPNVQGSDQTQMEEESDFLVLASDLIRIIESSILTFHLFLKMDKKKSSGVLNLFGGQNQTATPLQQIQSFLEKKEIKLKELRRKQKGRKKKSWPATHAEVEMLFGLIDIKVLSRVLRMERITKEQLLWCEEKMNKLELLDGKLQRDPSPTLFPC